MPAEPGIIRMVGRSWQVRMGRPKAPGGAMRVGRGKGRDA